MPEAKGKGIIVHFHGPKPWEIYNPMWDELRMQHFDHFRNRWLALMNEEELAEVEAMEQAQKQEREKKELEKKERKSQE